MVAERHTGGATWHSLVCAVALLTGLWLATPGPATAAPPPNLDCLHGVVLTAPPANERSAFSAPLTAIRLSALRSRDSREVVGRVLDRLTSDVKVTWDLGRGDGQWHAVGPEPRTSLRVAIPEALLGDEHLLVRAVLTRATGSRVAVCAHAITAPDAALDPVLAAFNVGK